MAVTSGTVYSSTYKDSGERGLCVKWSRTSTSISGNYSNIKWSLEGYAGTDTRWYISRKFKVIINGSQVYYNSDSMKLYKGTVVASGTAKIPHGSNGQKTFSIYVEGAIYTASVNVEGTKSFELPLIPREAEITSAPNFDDEDNPKITYENLAGNSISSLQACISWTGGDDITYRNISKTGTSYTFNFTTAERKKLRQALTGNSREVKFYVRSVIGGKTYYSTLTKTLTLINGTPTFNDFEVYDDDPTTTALYNDPHIFLQGVSDIKLKITTGNKMVAKKEATAKSYNASLEGTNISIPYSNSEIIKHIIYNPNYNGNKTFTVRAYDSRNNTKAVYKTITILPYKNIVINASATRLNNFENETTLKIGGSFSSVVVGGTEKNDIGYVKYRYKEDGGSFNSYTTLTVNKSGTNYSCDNIILDLDNSKKYIFEVVAKDKIYERTTTIPVDIGEPIFFINADGGVDIEGDLNINGTIKTAKNQNIAQSKSGINLNNSDIIGINGVVFADECNSNYEGILFPKEGTIISSDKNDYHNLRGYRGKLYFDNKIVPFYDIGDIKITSTNTNPSGKYGGTWVLVGKEFIKTWKVINIDNDVCNGKIEILRTGTTCTLYGDNLTTKIDIGDTTAIWYTFNLKNDIGVSRLTKKTYMICGTELDDGGINMVMHETNGELYSNHIVNTSPDGVYINAGAILELSWAIPCEWLYMEDEACDKFFWKKTG